MRISCDHCGKPLGARKIREIAAELGRSNVAKRKRHVAGPGRRKILKPCPTCGEELGVVEMRRHKCPISAAAAEKGDAI